MRIKKFWEQIIWLAGATTSFYMANDFFLYSWMVISVLYCVGDLFYFKFARSSEEYTSEVFSKYVPLKKANKLATPWQNIVIEGIIGFVYLINGYNLTGVFICAVSSFMFKPNQMFEHGAINYLEEQRQKE